MMTTKISRLAFFSLLFLLGLTQCKIADISQASELSIPKSEQIAEEKLLEVIEEQGFEVMKEKNVYQFSASDDWPGLIGKIVKIWPDQNTHFIFKHNFNTFDGSALFLNGEKEGDLIGLQSWNYYEKKKGTTEVINKDTGTTFNKLEFGLVVFHYFLELPYRLQNAPIKRYYGQRVLKGQHYDLVFASWGSETANEKHDQYILWINQATKLVDYCIYTLRDNTNPLTRHKYGSIAFLNYQDVDGFKVPFKMPILIDDGVIKASSLDQYFHQFLIEDFSFGNFEESELYPLKGIEKWGDRK